MLPDRDSLVQVGFWKPLPQPDEDCASDGPVPKLLAMAMRLAANRLNSYPDVRDCIDWKWASKERAAVIAYLEDGRRAAAYMGWSDCRICGKENGTCDLTDGIYVWPQGFSHYLRAHQVRPPADFVAHVLKGCRR